MHPVCALPPITDQTNGLWPCASFHGGRQDCASVAGQRATPGELPQIRPAPRHFEQAMPLVTPDRVADNVACGDGVEVHLSAINAYADAEFDAVYISQIGPAWARRRNAREK